MFFFLPYLVFLQLFLVLLVVFNFLRSQYDSSINIFYIYYRYIKYLFFIIFSICVAMYSFFFPFMIFKKNYVCVDFYYRLILVNKFIKYNQVNDPCFNIKYLIYICFSIFPLAFLIIGNDFIFSFIYTIVCDLFNSMCV